MDKLDVIFGLPKPKKKKVTNNTNLLLSKGVAKV